MVTASAAAWIVSSSRSRSISQNGRGGAAGPFTPIPTPLLPAVRYFDGHRVCCCLDRLQLEIALNFPKWTRRRCRSIHSHPYRRDSRCPLRSHPAIRVNRCEIPYARQTRRLDSTDGSGTKASFEMNPMRLQQIAQTVPERGNSQNKE